MPSINLKLAHKVGKEEELAVKAKLGQAISILPGKTEAKLMITFEDEVSIYFKGEDIEKGAFVEVKVFGQPLPKPCNELTGEICKILDKELEIPPENVYVRYEGTDIWGWNGNNF